MLKLVDCKVDMAEGNRSDGRVVRVHEVANSGSILSRFKPTTIKLVFTAFLLDTLC